MCDLSYSASGWRGALDIDSPPRAHAGTLGPQLVMLFGETGDS